MYAWSDQYSHGDSKYNMTFAIISIFHLSLANYMDVQKYHGSRRDRDMQTFSAADFILVMVYVINLGSVLCFWQNNSFAAAASDDLYVII